MKIHYIFLYYLIVCLVSCVSKTNYDDLSTSQNINATKLLEDNDHDHHDESGLSDPAIRKYDESGNGIFGRQIVYRNIASIIRNAGDESGKIAYLICIDPEGKVISANLDENETTISNTEILKNSEEAIYGYRFRAEPKAALEECGKIVLNIRKFN